MPHEYLIGTEVRDKGGRVRKKIGGGLDGGTKWIAKARYVFMHKHGKDLTSNDRIFHADGDLANDDPSNLVCVRFSGKRYAFKASKVVWEPKKIQRVTSYIPKHNPSQRQLAVF